jgi:hypothetical protein
MITCHVRDEIDAGDASSEMTNAIRPGMKILRRPKRSVRYPKIGPPKKLPASDDAPMSPSSPRTGRAPS